LDGGLGFFSFLPRGGLLSTGERFQRGFPLPFFVFTPNQGGDTSLDGVDRAICPSKVVRGFR
jgi:hypothetical protein